MGQPYRRVCRVNALTAVAGRTVNVHPDIVRVEIDLDVIHLRQHRHRRRGCMDPAAGLRFRDPLYTVRAALELQAGVSAFSLNEKDRFLDASDGRIIDFDQLGLPAISLRIPGVHS